MSRYRASEAIRLAEVTTEPDRTIAASRSLQVVSVVIAWLYMSALNFRNDGLWYAGDAARHALNGVFWWDFLSRRPLDPTQFALSYYARYPAINPTSYPPLFYWIEGAAFWIFGISPFVAKGVVLGFALLGGLYLTAWLRRWLSPEAGWGGALFLLQPGILSWSHTIMLNVPSASLGLAALYHARRWLDRPVSRQLYLTMGWGVAGFLTYFPTLVIAGAMAAWFVVEGRWENLRRRKTRIFAPILALTFMAAVAVAFRWAPMHLSLAIPTPSSLLTMSRWTYYFLRLPQVLSMPILVLSGFAVWTVLFNRRSRAELLSAIIWFVACYAGLSYLSEREARYALLLVAPVVILGVGGLLALIRLAGDRIPSSSFAMLLGALLLLHAVLAWFVHFPKIDGLREVVAFLEKEAPNGMIFYEGENSGAFTFYVRAGDPEFRRGVVRGNKLLYSSAILKHWRLKERVSSPVEVVDVLRRECGCQWLAIERSIEPDDVGAVNALREALKGPEFELVKSFPIQAIRSSHVDVYRFAEPVDQPDRLRLPFPVLGQDREFQVRPIERNW